MANIKPPFLSIGDSVAIIAPASRVNKQDIVEGIQILKSWGLNVIIGDTIGGNHYNFSATDTLRLQEFQMFLDNPAINLILCARGGYGTTRYLDHLNFTEFIKHPKWICGFSDVTSILMHVNNIGFEAIHGPMLKTLNWDLKSTNFLYKYLFGKSNSYKIKGLKDNKIGNGKGEAIGGNLCLLVNNLSTQSDISYDNKILFLEDIGEYLYATDRMLTHLLRAGKLNNLAGLVVGDFSNIKTEGHKFGQNIKQMVLSKTQGFNYPVAFGFKFGHESVNYPIVLGRSYELNITPYSTELRDC